MWATQRYACDHKLVTSVAYVWCHYRNLGEWGVLFAKLVELRITTKYDLALGLLKIVIGSVAGNNHSVKIFLTVIIHHTFL